MATKKKNGVEPVETIEAVLVGDRLRITGMPEYKPHWVWTVVDRCHPDIQQITLSITSTKAASLVSEGKAEVVTR